MELKRFFASKKSYFVLGLVLFFISAGVFGLAWTARASLINTVITRLIAPLCTDLLIPLLSSLLLTLTSVLIWISGYNDFINAQAVVNGWAMVRDMANMFFIIILLIVAFGTILGEETLHYKKLLPKILIMALLINFSRTLAGLLIDMAQVVMITFVNGFSAAAGGNFANALQLDKIMKLNEAALRTASESASAGDMKMQAAGIAIFGLVILIISVVFITVMVAVLAFRIFMLWMLIILSPIAWLLGTVPQGQKYYAQWWEQFRDQVVVGPVLAFFLWLTLATVGNGAGWQELKGPGRPSLIPTTAEANRQYPEYAGGIAQIMNIDSLVSYIVAIGMLLAGLQISQQMGGAISGIAGKAKNFATRGLKLGAKVGLAPVKFGVGFAERKLYHMTGVGLNPMRYIEKWKAYSQRRQMIDEAHGAARAGASAKEIAAKGGALWGLAGVARIALGSPQDFFENYMGWRGVKRFGGVLAGGVTKAAAIRDEAEKKVKDRGLMRTQDEQQEQKEGLGKMDNKIIESTNYSQRVAEQINNGKIDLSDDENRAFVTNFYKSLKKQEKELKDSGEESDANKIKENAEILKKVVDEKGIFNLDDFTDSGVRDQFKVAAQAMYENLLVQIKKLNETKIKVEAEIQLADNKGLVYATQGKRDEEYKKISEVIKKLNKAAAWRTPPQAFYAAENFRHLEAEERKQMPSHSMEATEVVEEVNSALVEKNKVKFAAWLKKAAEDYNDNEVFNSFGYDGGYNGIVKFRKEILMKQLGMTEQESMTLMNDINYMNEEKNHFNASRMYKFENGRFQERSHDEQSTIVMIENMKKDSRKFCQNTNRLGYGYETPAGRYRLDKAGLATIVALQNDIIYRIGRAEMNPSALNKWGEALDQLIDLERRGLMTSRNAQGQNLVDLVRAAKAAGPFQTGMNYEKQKDFVAHISAGMSF